VVCGLVDVFRDSNEVVVANFEMESDDEDLKWSSLDEVEVDVVDGSEEDGLNVDDLAPHPRNVSDADSDD
jgi:hypothetical protein